MEALQQRIREQGRYLGGGILKVDAFLNHQVDPQLMMVCGEAIAQRFAALAPTKVFTAEISGIAPALMAAYCLGVPLVFARKHRPITLPKNAWREQVPSPTKGGMVDLWLSPEWMTPQDRVLIVDDFLASGRTIVALARLVHRAGAQVLGVAVLIEKVFQQGRVYLRKHLGEVPVYALARIQQFTPTGEVIFTSSEA